VKADDSLMAIAASQMQQPSSDLPLAAAPQPKANGNDYEECLSCQ
jgi:hypothetical protein